MNITRYIQEKAGLRLHQRVGHPVEYVKRAVQERLPGFVRYDDLDPVVTVRQNFDDLLVPLDHISRRPSDTYYVDAEHVLRTHTTAHLPDLLARHERFLVTGDVYRREAIDRTHYPVFHQMEGLKVVADPVADLRATIDGLLDGLLPGHRRLVTESHFTYTDPSFEVQVEFGGRWLEVMGGGVVRPEVMARAGRSGETAWAFGLGLDRLAMLMLGLTDIQLLWEWGKKIC